MSNLRREKRKYRTKSGKTAYRNIRVATASMVAGGGKRKGMKSDNGPMTHQEFMNKHGAVLLKHSAKAGAFSGLAGYTTARLIHRASGDAHAAAMGGLAANFTAGQLSSLHSGRNAKVQAMRRDFHRMSEAGKFGAVAKSALALYGTSAATSLGTHALTHRLG